MKIFKFAYAESTWAAYEDYRVVECNTVKYWGKYYPSIEKPGELGAPSSELFRYSEDQGSFDEFLTYIRRNADVVLSPSLAWMRERYNLDNKVYQD